MPIFNTPMIYWIIMFLLLHHKCSKKLEILPTLCQWLFQLRNNLDWILNSLVLKVCVVFPSYHVVIWVLVLWCLGIAICSADTCCPTLHKISSPWCTVLLFDQQHPNENISINVIILKTVKIIEMLWLLSILHIPICILSHSLASAVFHIFVNDHTVDLIESALLQLMVLSNLWRIHNEYILGNQKYILEGKQSNKK